MSSTFGTVVRLPSGRYRAQFYGPEGKRGRRYAGPTTFRTKAEARQFRATVHNDMARGKWMPPDDTAAAEAPGAPVLTLAAYAEQWLAHRDLQDRTREHYRKLLDARILGAPLRGPSRPGPASPAEGCPTPEPSAPRWAACRSSRSPPTTCGRGTPNWTSPHRHSARTRTAYCGPFSATPYVMGRLPPSPPTFAGPEAPNVR